MVDKKISNNQHIDAALQLDGDPGKVSAFYEDWAERYNIDVDSADYSAPGIAAKLLKQYLPDSDSKILDAGCGTGLVGIELQALGFSNIDGFDLSNSMAQRAIATGKYQQVQAGVDMMRAMESYPDAGYDSVLSIGVFTLGHVPPQALEILLQLTRPGGLLVISTRTHYYDQSNYRQVVDDLVAGNRIVLLQLIENAPYNEDGDGHYWVFRKAG